MGQQVGPVRTKKGSVVEQVNLPWASLGHLLEDAASKHPAQSFIIFEGERISYADADKRVNRIANVLRGLGLQKGARVGVMMPNGLDFPLIWLALAKTGLVLVPVNVEYQHHDLEYVLRDSGAEAAIVHAGFESRLQQTASSLKDLRHVIVAGAGDKDAAGFEARVAQASPQHMIADVGEHDLINIQYTSGTTGFPKGCMLTHRYWMLIGHFGKEILGANAKDVNFNAQPFYYMDGMWNLTLCMMAGIPLVLAPRFSVSKFWRTVADNGVTFFYCLGAMPVMLMNREADALEKQHKVRAVYCSGIGPQMHRELETRFGCPWREGYGTTESGTETMARLDDFASVGTGSLGRNIASKESRIVDNAGREVAQGGTGEYISRGEPVMLGYWNKPEATAETLREGWFHSGDLGFKDAQGGFHIVGRIKDMVRRSGENISTAEVESVLVLHPSVKLAAVVPVPDEVRGEEVKAYVVLRDGENPETVSPQSIIDHAKSQLAAFKVPRYVEFVDALPMTPSERVEKHKLIKAKTDLRLGSYDRTAGDWIRA